MHICIIVKELSHNKIAHSFQHIVKYAIKWRHYELTSAHISTRTPENTLQPYVPMFGVRFLLHIFSDQSIMLF